MSGWRSGMTQLRLRGGVGCERPALAAVRAAGRRAGMDEARLADIETAVAEACLNGLEHGSRRQSCGRPVDVTFGVERDVFRVAIHDGGRGFDPARIAKPSVGAALAGDARGRGWGLFLMQQLADQVDIASGRDGCTVELRFSLAGGGDQNDGH